MAIDCQIPFRLSLFRPPCFLSLSFYLSLSLPRFPYPRSPFSTRLFIPSADMHRVLSLGLSHAKSFFPHLQFRLIQPLFYSLLEKSMSVLSISLCSASKHTCVTCERIQHYSAYTCFPVYSISSVKSVQEEFPKDG